jgi:hypothetical protein
LRAEKYSATFLMNQKIMSEKLNYASAFEELQSIVADIEQGEISVDELSEKVNVQWR